MNIVLGVAGGIAAYKACEVLRRLRELGHHVRCIPTPNALEFVGRTTWEALAGHPVSTDVFTDTAGVAHVRHGQAADLIVIAPATADLLARMVMGRADDLLTSSLLVATCPVIVFPAMHTEMWHHPATQANVATLRERGVVVCDPDIGRLTGADSGPGRLPEPARIASMAALLVESPLVAPRASQRDLAGQRLVISAGGTRQHLDPVRYLGNASSGKMGMALARAAVLRGGHVDLVASVPMPTQESGITVHPVVSTQEMAEAVWRLADGASAVIMAAAPADYEPLNVSDTKLKKEPGTTTRTLQLQETPDILAGLAGRKSDGRVDVGFAAETATDAAELVELGTSKLKRKGCDLLVCNNVSGGAVFGSDETHVIVLDREQASPYSGSKDAVAHHILDHLRSAHDHQPVHF